MFPPPKRPHPNDDIEPGGAAPPTALFPDSMSLRSAIAFSKIVPVPLLLLPCAAPLNVPPPAVLPASFTAAGGVTAAGSVVVLGAGIVL